MIKKVLIIGLILLVFLVDAARSQQIEKKSSKYFRYIVYLPQSYQKDTTMKWPMILFLHGAGEGGFNLRRVSRTGPLEFALTGQKLPFIIVSPQIRRWHFWSPDSVKDFLTDIISKYNVDTKRIYLTGLSIGGKATWETAMKYPGMFAAIAPVSGWASPALLPRLRNTPVWIFHGAKDPVVPVIASEVMADSLKKFNNVKLTIYPNGTHGNWSETYNNEKLYSWFLAHNKK
jgi:predicted peptidase